MLPPNVAYNKLNIKFKRPVYIDDIIQIEMDVREDNNLRVVIQKMGNE
jgi:acyl-CoA thioesterase FadM